MTDPSEFEFNLKKARQSIILFIVVSLVFISLVVFTNNNLSGGLSENTALLLFLLFFYFGYLAILMWRLYIAHNGEVPKITIKEGLLLIPSFHLGKKRIPLADICTLESSASKSNNEFIVLGLIDKSRCIIDKLLFSDKTDFYEFKKVLQKSVDKNSKAETRRAIEKISSFQKNKRTVVTITITILCVLVYFLSTSLSLELPENPELVIQGAGTKDTLSSGEFYRIFTSPFFHLSVFHLLLNLFVLGVMGELLERVITGIRFLNIFLLSSLVAYASFVLFSNYAMGVGASGGVFGLWGAYFALKLRHEKYLPGSVNAIPLKRLMGVLVIEFLAEIFLFDNVGYEVHLGGFIAGFAYLYLAPLGPKLETVDQPTIFEKGLFVVLVSSYTVGLSYFLFLYYGLI